MRPDIVGYAIVVHVKKPDNKFDSLHHEGQQLMSTKKAYNRYWYLPGALKIY